MSAEDRKKRRNKQLARNLILEGLFAVVAGCCGFYMLREYIQEQQNEEMYESLRAQAESTHEETTPAETTPAPTTQETTTEPESESETKQELIFCEPVQDFDALEEKNKDIYSWIYVPGTAVDYPVLQSSKDNYYLDHNLNHSQGYPGCIYSNQCNKMDYSDYLTVLYGHNLSRDRMFGSLHRFEDGEFFEENRQIVMYTPTKRLTYEVLAAVKYTDDYVPYKFDISSYQGMSEFWDSVEACSEDKRSHVLADVELEETDKLLILSTCIRDANNQRMDENRYLVVGRLVEEALYFPELPEETTEAAETSQEEAE